MDKLLQRLIDRRDRLSVAIEILREETGERRARKTMRRAATAAAMLASNGDTPAPMARKKVGGGGVKPTPRRSNKPRQQFHTKSSPFRSTGRDIVPVPLPSGVSLANVDFPKAVALAVQAVRKPIPTPELSLLLETAGVTFPDQKHPRIRYVGLVAASLVRARVLRKTPEGWIARGK